MTERKPSNSVEKAGETPPEPIEGNLNVGEIDAGYGEIGFIVQWLHLEDGWIMAQDQDSYVSLDNSV